MIKDNDAFNNMLNADPEIDYTGKQSDYYTEKYVNRPEDAGTMEGIHHTLAGAGVVHPLADAINASIYAMEGNYTMAGLSASAILPMGTIFASGKKIISKALTEGADSYAKYNRQLNAIGETADYINPKTIYNGRYSISHTNKAVRDGNRPAVVVRIKNLETGTVVHQPFYRSTGTGHDAASKGNWLPFEGILSGGSEVSYKVAKNKSKVAWAADETVPGWRGRATDASAGGGVKFKEGIMPAGWYIKAFKGKNGDLITSTIYENKIKRGLPVHEEIDWYLRNNLNFDQIPKNLNKIKATPQPKEMTKLERVLERLRTSENAGGNIRRVMDEIKDKHKPRG